ncbi:hypothetical protein T4D_16352 [Trichinella pseudospiralis]|uniref:Uncharacterized protein n=1 Tax=Trichinella pseudospiralis TaxID=6337 RepID=A0A0V1FPG2_TRIPS|nr:hypothetical protein T4D_16352 [Trichinella pseudospiralis]
MGMIMKAIKRRPRLKAGKSIRSTIRPQPCHTNYRRSNGQSKPNQVTHRNTPNYTTTTDVTTGPTYSLLIRRFPLPKPGCYLNKAFARLNKKTDLAIKIVKVALAAMMRYLGKEETSGTLQIIVRGKAVAVSEHYGGSSAAAAVNGWNEADKLKWLREEHFASYHFSF